MPCIGRRVNASRRKRRRLVVAKLTSATRIAAPAEVYEWRSQVASCDRILRAEAERPAASILIEKGCPTRLISRGFGGYSVVSFWSVQRDTRAACYELAWSCSPVSAANNHALAIFQSRLTVSGEISR